jgi:hypothetical protein
VSAADVLLGAEPEPSPSEALADLLKLPTVGLAITRAVVHGHGSKASATIHLSDGSVIEFETLKDVANAQRLMVEVIATTGAMPRLKPTDAHRALMLLRAGADHQEVMSQDDISIDTGMTFLQLAQVIDVDMSDQMQRWPAFSYLSELHPAEASKFEVKPYAEACCVLRDLNGNQYVRCGWFYGHARDLDRGVSQAEVAHRMERVGWQRRGRRGAIKATSPTRDAHLIWNFYVVPASWNDTQTDAGQVVALSQVLTNRTHVEDAQSSRVEATTGDNPKRAA